MRTFGLLLVGVLTAAAVTLQAQENSSGDNTIAAQANEKFKAWSADKKTKYANDQVKDVKGMLPRILELKAAANKSKNVIKQNCVNDHLIAFKKILLLAEQGRNDLLEDISSGNVDEQVHGLAKLDIIHSRAVQTSADAEACIGDELIFVGEGDVTVEGPELGKDKMSSYKNLGFERANLASPYF